MIKTRVQTHDLQTSRDEFRVLLSDQTSRNETKPHSRPSTFRIAQQAYRQEGLGVFFRGIGICSARAFIVNAVQWAVSSIKCASAGALYSRIFAGLRVDDEATCSGINDVVEEHGEVGHEITWLQNHA